MKTVSVREMKAHWADVERCVRDGETVEVQNRGRATVRIVPARPRGVVKWDDHLATAVPSSEASGKSGADAVRDSREGRW